MLKVGVIGAGIIGKKYLKIVEDSTFLISLDFMKEIIK